MFWLALALQVGVLLGAPGIVVEEVGKGSATEKAGLMASDVIVSWMRGRVKGKINSPFDLSEIEAEEAPRGDVKLRGRRGKLMRVWVVRSGRWGIVTRPELTPKKKVAAVPKAAQWQTKLSVRSE